MAQTTRSPDPRTGLVELTPEECWYRLEQGSFGRIAVSDGGSPDIFPVNYKVHDAELVIHTEAGTKLAAATLSGSVAFEIDRIDPETRRGWSIVVKGHGYEPKTVEKVMELEALDVTPWVHAPKSRWLVITPHEVTGRGIF